MFKKIFSILIIFFGFVFLAIFAAFACLKFAFPEAKLKMLAKDGIRGFISRESSFGKIHLGFSGIEIEDFSLSELPDFKEGTFLSAKKISFKPGFLSGSMSGKLIIDSPKIHFTAAGPYSWNFSDISGQAMKKDRPMGRGYGYFPVFSAIKVNDGEIVFTGKKRGLPDMSARKIFIDISPGGSGAEYNAGLKADILSDGSELGLDSDLSYDPASRAIQIKKSEIRQSRKLVTASGYIENCFSEGKKTEFDINVAGDRTVLDTVIKIISKSSGVQFGENEKINLEISGTADKFKVKEK